MWSIFLSLSVLLDLVLSSTKLSNSLSETSDDYTSIKIEVGTPGQSLTVLLDTTNTETFVMTNNTKSLSSKQDYFVTSDSSTYKSSSNTFTYTYENATINGTEGSDTIQVGDLNLTGVTLGLADYNQDLFETEKLGGALSLGRTGEFISKFKDSKDIDVYKIIVDIGSKMLHIGDYSANEKNVTEVDCYTNNSNITKYWAFEFSSFGSEGTAELFTCNSKCFGVIDTASPYLTFSMSSSEYTSLFKNVGGKGNCKESTLKCDDSSDITSYLYFTIGNDTFYMSKDDYYYDKKLHLQWTDSLVEDGMVVFFGKPWLETLQVALHASNNTISFIYTSSGSNVDKWETVWITAICVIAFAILFFGLFFWKFKIPAPARRNQNEEQALLHGQPPRAQPHQPLGPAPPQRPAAPPAEPAQPVGSTTGAANSTDPDEIRRRRLQFLASQEQQPQTEE